MTGHAFSRHEALESLGKLCFMTWVKSFSFSGPEFLHTKVEMKLTFQYDCMDS